MITISWTARIIGPDGQTISATFEAPEDNGMARTEAERLYGKDNVYVYYPTDMARRHRYVRELHRRVDRMADYFMGRLEPIADQDDHDPDFNPYIWDGDRIEATKTVLFHEFIAQGEGLK